MRVEQETKDRSKEQSRVLHSSLPPSSSLGEKVKKAEAKIVTGVNRVTPAIIKPGLISAHFDFTTLGNL